MKMQVENRKHPSGPEEREVGSFRFLIWCTYHTCQPGQQHFQAWRDGLGARYADQDTRFLPSFNSVTVTVLQMQCTSTSPACSRTTGSQWRLNSSTSPRCGKAPPYSSQWGLPLQIPANNAFPGWDGTRCSQERSMSIQGESQLMAISWDFHIFKMMDTSSVAPSLACEITGPTDWSYRCISSIL